MCDFGITNTPHFCFLFKQDFCSMERHFCPIVKSKIEHLQNFCVDWKLEFFVSKA
jgi:hypothetical protein